MSNGNKIQKLLDKPNPQFDPSSPEATKRRKLMQENPVKDIRAYIAGKACPNCGYKAKAVKSFEK